MGIAATERCVNECSGIGAGANKLESPRVTTAFDNVPRGYEGSALGIGGDGCKDE